ncbi:MAG: acetate--CoA ligase family protein [Melioribacteraceae bacterium]|nr:acetate--CoA ligase family protein [Melioribacteraceae bacterium]MCF8354884.1 acetate--CoA ligase family protein [Melioribacteraceae bacterium]MCF8393894.1 acetate--CoA ligase family protein [Melioribacteraceae bacterium]MCF8419666.1 acetate--CoA ligase family protein [Melioribacteraceae bacterium]
MSSEIRNFFYPKSICVVGASSKENSIGYEILKTMKNYGYNGNIFPVNPKAGSILGYDCYKSIDDINERIELAIIVVPKQFVLPSIDSLLQKHVKSILLITAGFKEIGKEGEKQEQRIIDTVKLGGARLVGPNCMGLINTLPGIKLNATFVAEKPETGSTGFLSQSGALGAAVLNSLRETDIKFAHFISVGNKADINENDLIDYWQNDDNIKTITLYLESFINGEEIIKKKIKGEISKPVIILKAGKTMSGMKAASSHTGALSTQDTIVNAVLNQFGFIRVNNLNELFNTAKGFENFPIPHGNRVAVVTNAGGPAILTVDTLEKENLKLADFTDETKEKLRSIVHPEGSVNNPVDLLPGAASRNYRNVIETIVRDENVDAVISIFVEPVMVQPFEVVEAVNGIESEKPIIQVDMPLPEFWDKYRHESKTNLPIFRNPEDPAEVISNLLFHNKSNDRLNKSRDEYLSILNSENEARYNFEDGFLSQSEINKIAEDYRLPVIKHKLVKPGDLIDFDENFYPVVLKGINSEVIHKSELHAVKLNIMNKNELIKSAGDIEKNFSKYDFLVEEFLIQKQVKIKHEILIGGYRDASFGPVIMFGTGGKYVEIICDTAIKSAYISDDDIDDMLNSTMIGRIIQGVRGEEPCDLAGIKRIIKSCARMLIENPEIDSFDLNPLIIDEDNLLHIVDVRIEIKRKKPISSY